MPKVISFADFLVFKELNIADLDISQPLDPSFKQTELQNIEDALVLGLRDYVYKCGFRKALSDLVAA